MRYEILGPLRVVDAEGSHSIKSQKIEILLGTFLIYAGQVLTADQLKAEIWGTAPPRRAAATLQVYVSQLRKFLARGAGSGNPIVTCPAGYFLRVGSDEIDLHTFTSLVQDGRRHAKLLEHANARAALEAALTLYRGPALGGVQAGAIISQFGTWLEETRLECVELLTESKLGLGCHREVVGDLYSLVGEQPFREAFYRQLMLALYRSDRQADALKVYQSARVTLRVELGVEPCRQLQDLQRAILTADDRLEILRAG